MTHIRIHRSISAAAKYRFGFLEKRCKDLQTIKSKKEINERKMQTIKRIWKKKVEML